MKSIRVVLFVFLVIILSSCHHTTDTLLYIPQNITQLNTVVAPWQKDNDLLPWKGVNHMDIINSVEDVYATQTERFIAENPNWLNVDFSTQSIVTLRTVLMSSNYWLYTKVLGFSIYCGDPDGFMNKGDYYLVVEDKYAPYDYDVEDDDENQYRIYQVAFISDKVPYDAQIKMNKIFSTSVDGN